MVLGLLPAPAHHQVLQVLAGQRSAVLPQQRQHLLGWQRPPLQSSTSSTTRPREMADTCSLVLRLWILLRTIVYSKLVGALTQIQLATLSIHGCDVS